MARATKIYIVTDAERIPIAAFTVKHECKTWLGTARAALTNPFWVASLTDGRFEPTIPVWDIKGFLESRP